jgi:4-amino-4-deoxy-L-arabinose transferase-like glycosyltransferase
LSGSRYSAHVNSSEPRWKRIAVPCLLAVVLAYAALVRLDRLVLAYGPFGHPGWLVTLQRTVGALRPLTPPGWEWGKVEQPYVGGDPINYLKYAREMTHFYQGHVREPVFLATTRVFLWLTDDQDVAVSFASLTFSVLCVLATYLLGSALGSRWIGLLAAAALAIEHEIVTWAPDGWRDDAFAAFVALSAWALLRLRQSWTWRWAILTGIAGGMACLTRLSSLTFLLPALLWLAWPRDRAQWRAQAARVAVAAAVMIVLVAPYLVNSYRASGDVFYAVNYHTTFYEYSEGAVSETPPTAFAWTTRHFRQTPIAATDTAVRGLFVYPFVTKWRGFGNTSALLARVLPWLAVGGLVLWLAQPAGRLLLVILLTSLVPYMLIWSIRGGDHWRFTMQTYPFYLVAAFSFAFAIGAGALRIARQGVRPTLACVNSRRALQAGGLGLLVVGLALLEDHWIPYLIARESLQTGASTSVAAGPGDGVFFTDGWSDLVQGGAVVARLATKKVVTVQLPVPERRAYRLVIRMDPIVPDATPPQRVRAFLGGHAIGVFTLTWNPERVGAYTVDVPAGLVPPGRTQLELMADDLVPLAQAGNAFPELPRDLQAAFRLWYVRLGPL